MRPVKYVSILRTVFVNDLQQRLVWDQNFDEKFSALVDSKADIYTIMKNVVVPNQGCKGASHSRGLEKRPPKKQFWGIS